MVKRMQQSNPLPVAIRHKNGGIRAHPIWVGNPRIVQPGDDDREMQWLDARGGCRPYIDYEKSTPEKWHWKPFDCGPGEIYLTPEERVMSRHGAGRIILEPNVKSGASPNKKWDVENWQELADYLRRQGFKVLQMGSPADHRLRRIEHLFTPSFRHACGVLSGAIGLITPEGALHHASAIFNIPTVVVRGGFIGPTVTGYAGQIDFFKSTPEYPIGCGWRVRCPHCTAAMQEIKARAVAAALVERIRQK